MKALLFILLVWSHLCFGQEFAEEWRLFLQNRQAENLEQEFALIEEFGALQLHRRRPVLEDMDRDGHFAPFLNNRVRLKDGTEMSASSLSVSPHTQFFIASQAPLSHNIHLFWQMIWENKVDQIVMLTELEEQRTEVKGDEPRGKVSASYWPTSKGEPLKLSNGLEVTFVEERWLLPQEKENVQIRTFLLRKEGQERLVIHYWYHNWIDGTNPTSPKTLLTLLQTVKDEKIFNTPILVHCRAGVGRTGLFITAYYLFQNEEPPSLFDIVASLRWQRPNMVSKFFLYQFLNDLIFVHR